jgi:glycosyltransferase involved in cell wall biosynthesis
MNIASIYNMTAFPPRGGNHVHAWQLVRHFRAAGHEVHTWGDETMPDVRDHPRTAAGFAALDGAADVLYVRVDARPFSRWPALVTGLLHTRRPVVWEINAPANENLAFSWLGGDRRSTGWLDRVRRQLHAWKQAPAILHEEVLRRRLARRVDTAVCVSTALAEYAQVGLGIARAVVVPNGADHQTQRPEGPIATLPATFAGCLTVLYAGSPIYPWQGLDVLEATIRLCEAHGDPVRFVLLLNQEAPRPITAANTLVVHQVPHEQVSAYIRAVDVGVAIHPDYTWSRWGFHGSPMKMYDYMACGRPVVASALGQMTEVITPGRNGVLFDNTPEGLRRTLLELASGRHDLGAMGRAARADVERTFNWAANADRTLAELAAAVGRAKSAASVAA